MASVSVSGVGARRSRSIRRRAETAESAQDIYSDTYGKFILLLFVSIILSTIIRASTEKNSKRNIIKLIYIISVGILSFIILKSFFFVLIILIFNIIGNFLKPGVSSSGGGFSGGGFSGGGFSGGGFSGGGSSGGGGSSRSF